MGNWDLGTFFALILILIKSQTHKSRSLRTLHHALEENCGGYIRLLELREDSQVVHRNYLRHRHRLRWGQGVGDGGAPSGVSVTVGVGVQVGGSGVLVGGIGVLVGCGVKVGSDRWPVGRSGARSEGHMSWSEWVVAVKVTVEYRSGG